MNSKLAKQFRKLLALRTAPVTTYMRHKKNGNAVVPRDTAQGVYRGIKRARLTSTALRHNSILGTRYV